MPKKLKSVKQPIASLTRNSPGGILPFVERPSEERSQGGSTSRDGLEASELFSLFTANIIKEQKLFTR